MVAQWMIPRHDELQRIVAEWPGLQVAEVDRVGNDTDSFRNWPSIAANRTGQHSPEQNAFQLTVASPKSTTSNLVLRGGNKTSVAVERPILVPPP
jgi:hypothetical protein